MTEQLEQGVVVNVFETTVGDELAADAPAGSTTLTLVDAVDFDEDGGTALVNAELVTYDSADLDTDTLALAAPLVGSYLAGDSVLVQPESYVRTAVVQLDDSGEAIDARVPHSLYDRIPEGTRDVAESVSLVLDGGEWVISDVLGQQPLIDGSFIDSETMPSASDGEPPAASPATRITPLYSSLNASWYGLTNADAVAYDVYLSAPDRAATQIATVSGTVINVATEADGTPLRAGVTYSVWVHAFDADGYAPTAGAVGTGQLAGISREQLQQQVADEIAAATATSTQAQADASAAQSDADQALADALAAANAASAAQSDADTAQTTATAAQSDADAAQTAASAAQTTAESKGKVLVQSAAPAAADQLSQNLWIDTTGGANTPKRWTGSTWAVVTDKAATDAANAAATAQARADEAFQDAADAATAAGNAQTTANGKSRVWYQTSAPTGTGHRVDDLWFDTDDDNKPHRWSGSAWVAQPLGNAAIGNLDAAKITTGYLDVANRIETGSMGVDKLDAEIIVADETYSQLGYFGALSADQIEAGDIDAAVTVSGEVKTSEQGQRVVMDAQGLHLYDAAQQAIVDLPTDPTKRAEFKGNATMRQLTVTDSLSIDTAGSVGAGAGLELVGGITAPSTAPSVVLDHEVGGSYTVPIPAAEQAVASTLYVNAVAYTSTHVFVASRVDAIDRIDKIDLATGQSVASIELASPIDVHGLSVQGTTLLWALQWDGNQRKLVSYSITTLAAAGGSIILGSFGSGYLSKGVQIIGNVAHVGLISYAAGLTTPYLAKVDLSSSIVTTRNGSGIMTSAGVSQLGFSAGVFDYGDGITRFAFHGLTGSVVQVYNESGTTIVVRPDDRFDVGSDGGVGGNGVVTWTGTEFRQLAASASFAAGATSVSIGWKRFTGIKWTTESDLWWASYAWRDSDAAGAGGTNLTDEGVRASFTMKKRYRATLTSDTIPDNGGADDPNAVTFYVGRGATEPARTAMWQQGGTLANGVKTLALSSVAFSGTNPSATNDFPGSSPGYLKSYAKRSDGTTPQTYFDGLGVARADGLIPPGTIVMWAGAGVSVPDGWALCDGSTKSRTLDKPLYDAISTTYGAGDGATTFNLPNLTDRFPIGAGGARARGAAGGSETKTLTPAQLPEHTHGAGALTTSSAGGHKHPIDRSSATGSGGLVARGTGTSVVNNDTPVGSDGGHTHNITGDTGAGAGLNSSPVDVMPPFVGLGFIIKL